ncbi:MAG: hypothetical protein L6R40_007488 [Gallowayella cf. fulva]|nr:MAG: hypothetical protein L6R40_007488 [Xanthomendoza cf. fulva]
MAIAKTKKYAVDSYSSSGSSHALYSPVLCLYDSTQPRRKKIFEIIAVPFYLGKEAFPLSFTLPLLFHQSLSIAICTTTFTRYHVVANLRPLAGLGRTI